MAEFGQDRCDWGLLTHLMVLALTPTVTSLRRSILVLRLRRLRKLYAPSFELGGTRTYKDRRLNLHEMELLLVETFDRTC